jgi:hypothetical protein
MFRCMEVAGLREYRKVRRPVRTDSVLKPTPGRWCRANFQCRFAIAKMRVKFRNAYASRPPWPSSSRRSRTKKEAQCLCPQAPARLLSRFRRARHGCGHSIVPARAKAVLKPPHSRRWRVGVGRQTSRSVWTAARSPPLSRAREPCESSEIIARAKRGRKEKQRSSTFCTLEGCAGILSSKEGNKTESEVLGRQRPGWLRTGRLLEEG